MDLQQSGDTTTTVPDGPALKNSNSGKQWLEIFVLLSSDAQHSACAAADVGGGRQTVQESSHASSLCRSQLAKGPLPTVGNKRREQCGQVWGWLHERFDMYDMKGYMLSLKWHDASKCVHWASGCPGPRHGLCVSQQTLPCPCPGPCEISGGSVVGTHFPGCLLAAGAEGC